MWRMIAVLALKHKADKLRCGLHDLKKEHKNHEQYLSKHHHGSDDVAFELHERMRFEAEVGERVKAKHAERYTAKNRPNNRKIGSVLLPRNLQNSINTYQHSLCH
jgi:hypothetical protein